MVQIKFILWNVLESDAAYIFLNSDSGAEGQICLCTVLLAAPVSGAGAEM